MKEDGKIGTNSHGTSVSFRSLTMTAGKEVGFYGSGRKGMPLPRSLRSAYPRWRHAKMIGLLLVFAAAAIVIVSAMAHAPSAKRNELQPMVPADARAHTSPSPLIPGPPLLLYGYLYDYLGSPVVGADVTVTDTNTGISLTTVSIVGGFYQVQLADMDPGYSVGDTISVTAVMGTLSGTNSVVITGSEPGVIQLDVTLYEAIPEFPMVVVPVVGMIALVAAVRLRRGSEEQ